MHDVTLCEELTQKEVFVKGSYKHGWQKKVKNKRANTENNEGHINSKRSKHMESGENEVDVPLSTSHKNITVNDASSTSTSAPQTISSNASENDNKNTKNPPNMHYSKNENSADSQEVDTKNIKDYPSPMPTTLESSEEEVCGICYEVVMQKSFSKRRFGVLPNCNHCFCLKCIDKWRQFQQLNDNFRRVTCPECRVTSDFICPSTCWVETGPAKEKLLTNYKKNMSKENGCCSCLHYDNEDENSGDDNDDSFYDIYAQINK